MPRDIYPVLQYRDAHAALDWLERAFGFERTDVHEDGGRVVHAELRFGDGRLMLSSSRGDDGSGYPDQTGRGWLYVVVEDADAHHERAQAAGARIVKELSDQDYGSRDYSALDPEGNFWSFGTYAPA